MFGIGGSKWSDELKKWIPVSKSSVADNTRLVEYEWDDDKKVWVKSGSKGK